MVQTKSFNLLLLLLSLVSVVNAQHLLLPSDNSASLQETVFCRPGVSNSSRSRGAEFTYGLINGFNLQVNSLAADGQSLASVSHVESYKAKIKIPLLLKKDFKMLLGYEYNSETYHLNHASGAFAPTFESLDGKTLRTNKFTLYATKSFNDEVYALVRLRAAFNGDYAQGITMDHRYGIYSAIAGVGFKKSEKREWGVGLSFSHSEFRTRLIPFLVYNHTFNDKWGIESVLPIQILGRYNISRKTILLFGAEYNSKFYNTNLRNGFNDQLDPYFLKHSELQTSFTLEQKIVPWLWLHFKAGYQVPFSTDFINQSIPEASFEASPDGSLFFRIGLFLSPPDKLLNR